MLDPQLRELLESKGAFGAPRLEELGVDVARTVSGVLRPGADPGPASAHEEAYDVPGVGGPLRVVRPVGVDDSWVVLWVHGGGWMLGSGAASMPFVRRLAAAWGVEVVVSDYRLAPEHPYPAGVDDVAAAWRWVASQYPGRRVVLAGDSAGANLLLSAVARATSCGDAPRADALVAYYPVADPACAGASHADPERQAVLPSSTMQWFWDAYAPIGGGRVEARWSIPATWPRDVALPPTVLVTAEADVLVDEGDALAEQLSASGGEVAHRRWPGMTHGFVTLWPAPDATGEALAWSRARLDDLLA